MSMSELRVLIAQQLELLNEEQLKRLVSYVEEMQMEEPVDRDLLSDALSIMNERREVLQKLAQ